MQSDTNSDKSSQKNVSRRVNRSKEHESGTSDLKKSENHQKANHSKDSSSHSSKRNIQRHRKRSKNVKIRQMNEESLNVVQIDHVVFSSLERHHDFN